MRRHTGRSPASSTPRSPPRTTATFRGAITRIRVPSPHSESRTFPYSFDRVAPDECAVVRAPERPRRREQEPQDVVDLGRGPDGGAGRAPRRLLLDRDRGQDVLDEVHVGALEALEVLPRVRGHGLDEPALALRVERVEGERGLPGAGGARDDRERADGKGARHVLQVVRARADDRDRARARARARSARVTARRPRAGSGRRGSAGRTVSESRRPGRPSSRSVRERSPRARRGRGTDRRPSAAPASRGDRPSGWGVVDDQPASRRKEREEAGEDRRRLRDVLEDREKKNSFERRPRLERRRSRASRRCPIRRNLSSEISPAAPRARPDPGRSRCMPGAAPAGPSGRSRRRGRARRPARAAERRRGGPPRRAS